MKTILFLLFISLCFVLNSSGQKCGDLGDCGSCTAEPTCGWCAPNQMCLNGTANGPYNFTCIGNAWEFNGCTPCDRFTDCRECMARDTDCFWCNTANSGKGGCRDIGFTCTHATHCPCTLFGGCSDCLMDDNCVWCSQQDVCIETNETCSTPQPTLNYTDGCPCSAHRSCDDCNLADSCKWCLSGECADACTGQSVTSCQFYCNNASKICDGCVATEGCAWCPMTSSCVDAATSLCAFTYTCPVCSSASYCDTCTSISGCVWCQDTISCQPSNTACFISHSCPTYCETYTDCTTCSNARGCGWCADTGVCGDVAETMCFFTHSCTKKDDGLKCGFSGGAFVGGMFLIIGILIFIIAGYFFYRWRTGRKFDYRELK